jgi:hypothetical protein
MMAPPLKYLSPVAMLDRNKPGTPQTRAAANTYLPGYGPAGGKGERSATKMLTGG